MSGFRSPKYSAFTIREGHHEIALQCGETVAGRSAECGLILDGALVSRRHAVFYVNGDQAVLRDLGSRNGTAVNGQRVEGSIEIRPGDRILLGNMELSLGRRPTPEHRSSKELRRAQTLTTKAVRGEPQVDTLRLTIADDDDNTRSGHAFELLGGVVDKAFAMGKGAEAARLLDGPIQRVWKQSRRGREIDVELADAAADYAIRLAEATQDDSWVVKALDIFIAQQRPLPLSAIDRLYSLLRRLPQANRGLLNAYVKQLQNRRDSLSAAERFALKRLEGLIRIAAL